MTIKSTIILASGFFWLGLSPSAWSFYNPTTGRWLNRDPIGSGGRDSARGTRQLHKEVRMGNGNQVGFVSNRPIGLSDSDGRQAWPNPIPPRPPRPNSPGANYHSDCRDALSATDRSSIASAITEAEQRLAEVIDEVVPLPDHFAASVADCLYQKTLSGFVITCAGRCNPLCWYGDGWGVTGAGCITLCVSKIKASGTINDILLMMFHELCHTCAGGGHGTTDNPNEWAAWLTVVRATP